MLEKKWYKSKTLYFNVLSLLVIIIESALGQQFIPIEYQASILAVVNFILRAFVTKSNVTM